MTELPTILLIHGAFADASSFAALIPHLLDDGIPVVAPAGPNRSLSGDAAYIASATQADAHRTEPPFLLQGSYRDTSRMAERLVPVMNEEEIEAVIDDHYQAEAQTLTTGAEANLLKLAELRGRLDPRNDYVPVRLGVIQK